jgi:hypothetical protein
MKIAERIADTNFIHAAYRITGFNVKHGSRKIGLSANKKSQIYGIRLTLQKWDCKRISKQFSELICTELLEITTFRGHEKHMVYRY